MFKLIIEDDEGKTTVVPLSRDETSVGRKEGNTIRLTERNVSRRHARILRQNGAVYVEDLGSYNGVKINGNRIAGRVSVAEGDRIQIGDYLLGIKLDRTAEADPFAEQKTVPMPRGASPPGAVAESAAYHDTAPHGGAAAAAPAPPSTPTVRIPAQPPAAEPAAASAAPAPAAEPAGPAKLVCVSDNFYGKQFALDKAAVVIGRTEENDAIINHRSVSRHHAKVVRENGHYTIIDLQSANGVRVNGEEYGKVELRKGDIIDLGHVRLRFVAPGEDFVLERDATAFVHMPGARRGKTLVFVAIGAVCVVAGGAIALKDRIFGPAPPVAAPALDAGAARAVEPPKLAARDAAPKAIAPATGDAAALVAEIDRLMKDERWDQAIRRCGEGLQQDPGQEILRDKRARAQVEQKNQDALTVLSEAVDKKDPDRAYEAFKKIPDDSVYKKRADDLWTRAKAAFVQSHLARAKRLKEEGRCEQMTRELELVLTQEHGNLEAARIRKDCKSEAVALAPREKPPQEKPPKPPPPEKAAAPAQDDEKAKALLDQAAAASARGQTAQAISLAQQASKLTKKAGLLNRAYSLMALGHCSAGRKDAAQRSVNRLDGAWKAQVKSLCKSKGIELD
jgi:pSer/pThr/pTyr-binding forkhead associated (FHA) protein